MSQEAFVPDGLARRRRPLRARRTWAWWPTPTTSRSMAIPASWSASAATIAGSAAWSSPMAPGPREAGRTPRSATGDGRHPPEGAAQGGHGRGVRCHGDARPDQRRHQGPRAAGSGGGAGRPPPPRAAGGGLHPQPGRQARHPRRGVPLRPRRLPIPSRGPSGPAASSVARAGETSIGSPATTRSRSTCPPARTSSAALIGVFDSQITGGKRYDLAVAGLRRAHATLDESHHLDASTGLAFYMDLTPLLTDTARDPVAFARGARPAFRRGREGPPPEVAPDRAAMTGRREFIKAGAALSLLSGRARDGGRGAAACPPPTVADRLDQGPFGIEQDEGWYTDRHHHARRPAPSATSASGLVGYTWEENGPALAVRARRGARSSRRSRRSPRLPFVDVLYIRCDWRDVQSRPGRLDLHAGVGGDPRRRAPPRPARRLPRAALEPRDPAAIASRCPTSCSRRSRSSPLRRRGGRPGPKRVEPRYDHPEFQRAFRELERPARRGARRRPASSSSPT